jgi:hypothetical protein
MLDRFNRGDRPIDLCPVRQGWHRRTLVGPDRPGQTQFVQFADVVRGIPVENPEETVD